MIIFTLSWRRTLSCSLSNWEEIQVVIVIMIWEPILFYIKSMIVVGFGEGTLLNKSTATIVWIRSQVVVGHQDSVDHLGLLRVSLLSGRCLRWGDLSWTWTQFMLSKDYWLLRCLPLGPCISWRNLHGDQLFELPLDCLRPLILVVEHLRLLLLISILLERFESLLEVWISLAILLAVRCW